MFHQILGVAFFQFALFLPKKFLDHVFHLPPTFLKTYGNFVVYYQEYMVYIFFVLLKLDHLTITFQNDGSYFTITVKQEIYNMSNGLTYKIHS